MLKPWQLLGISSGSKTSPFVLTQYQRLHRHVLRKVSTVATAENDTLMSPSVSPTSPTIRRPVRPLSLLPLPNLLRSYMLTALSSYPLLLVPSLRLMSFVAHSSSAFLNPDQNPVLHWLLKKAFYEQYCAGETPVEVQKTVQGLKRMGYTGVILAYGKEIVLEKGQKLETPSSLEAKENAAEAEKDIQTWKEGTLKTVEMAEEGDFIGLKFSGAGQAVMQQLASNTSPSKAIIQATIEICDLAEKRGVRLLFDAEQAVVQRGIDAWTLLFQKRYNRKAHGKALVYGTYQAYLRSTPETVAYHLDTAKKEGFTVGVKLVRGAYMASDPRDLFWSKKDDTDKAYNGIIEALLKRRWNSTLRPFTMESTEGMAEVSLVLATHNHESVQKALNIRREQTERGDQKIDLSYGQLMGMADEVSCELVMTAKTMAATTYEKRDVMGPKAYKYLVWGSVGECLKYLVRRAEENRDAVIRAKGTRAALKTELRRRIWG